MKNPGAAEQTAAPAKYPQGHFKEKACRRCGNLFTPNAPSHLYCGDKCAREALTSRYLERTYNITIDCYRAMLEAQNHRCKICGGEGFLMKPEHEVKLVVDHCHETGEVRGLLCHNCNRGLGLFQDDTRALRAAINYLEGATTIPEGSRAKRPEAHSPCKG